MLTDEDFDRIEAMHRPTITWLGCAIGHACMCGASWPCPVMLLAEDARQWAARLRSVREAGS